MNDTEAISWIEQLAHEGALVWASCRPAMAGGGWAVRIIGPSGPDRMGHGATLGEALADALRGVEGVRSILKGGDRGGDRKSTRLNSSHVKISYAVFWLKKKIEA